MQEIKILPSWQIVDAQTRISLKNETHRCEIFEFEIQRDHSISLKRLNTEKINQKKRTRHLVDFAIPVNDRVKEKEKK